MKCPMRKTMNTTIPGELTFTQDDCLKEECAWWNDRFGMCSQAVDAYIKGHEDYLREIKSNREGG